MLSAKPLRDSHLREIQNCFENRRLTRLWCGYAFLNDIPQSCYSIAHVVNDPEFVGAALFINSEQHTQFVFRDLKNMFCLTNASGVILDHHPHLANLLDRFQQKPLR